MNGGKMLIFLCGFMGSGKTTFLNRLNTNDEGKGAGLNQFWDLDDEIYERYADYEQEASLGDLIRNRDWDFLREKERSLIREFCDLKGCVIHENGKKGHCLVALGGGALEGGNLDVIKNCEQSLLVWLDTPFEECYRRINRSGAKRPLVEKGEKYLHDLFSKRKGNYKKCDLRLGVDEQAQIRFLDDLLRSV